VKGYTFVLDNELQVELDQMCQEDIATIRSMALRWRGIRTDLHHQQAKVIGFSIDNLIKLLAHSRLYLTDIADLLPDADAVARAEAVEASEVRRVRCDVCDGVPAPSENPLRGESVDFDWGSDGEADEKGGVE